MRIEIGNKNKIKNSNIGIGNKIKKEDKSKQIIIDIFVGLFVTVIGGLILYYLTRFNFQYEFCETLGILKIKSRVQAPQSCCEE